MIQRLQEGLAIQFTCATTIEVGDIVEISDDLTVAVPGSAGSIKVAGEVIKHNTWPEDGLSCVVQTKFNRRRQRVSGAAVAVGAFVWSTGNKVINYDDQTHSPAAIAGLIITAADAADATVETLEF